MVISFNLIGKLDGSQKDTAAGTAVTDGVHPLYNLIMHMIRDLGSPALASVVSKAMLVETNRCDQTPYTLFSPSKKHCDTQILNAQEYIEKEYARISGINTVAKEVGISTRHFIRRFKSATGEVPYEWDSF